MMENKGNKIMDEDTIVIVSGLPRSGTSMLMSMLEAGGMVVLTDNIREADEDNPKGYYEFERVKELKADKAWLEDAKGKVVKMVSALLKHLPVGYNYRVIFMKRKMEEILASQKQMLIRRGKTTNEVSDERMAKLYQEHLEHIKMWLSKQTNFDVIYINYNDILKNPLENAEKLNKFLGNTLSLKEMIGVVDRNLYRQRYG